MTRFLCPLLGTGIALAEGETWKQHRKIISNSFHFEFLRQNIGLIQKTCRDYLSRVSPTDMNAFPVIEKLQEITGDVIGKIFFGENLSQYTFEGKPITLVLGELIADLALHSRTLLAVIFGHQILSLPIFPKYAKVLQRVHSFRGLCTRIVQDCKSSQTDGSSGLLRSLIKTQDSKDPHQTFSDEDIVNEFVTFFLAGMDTTGHLASMILYSLDRHPEYQAKLREERRSKYREGGEVTIENLQRMDVLQSIMKETLRFYPPATGLFIREAVEDHKLLDLKIRKGDLMRADFLPACFDERHFKEPERFNPERWLDQSLKIDPYAFTPFSAGPRNCIGQHLGQIETKIIVSEFLEMFSYRVQEGYQLRMTSRFLYEPHDKLHLVLRKVE